jgi:hypothetical protein
MNIQNILSQVTIGADPELFLIDNNGIFRSSIGLIGGSKDFPLPIGNGCAVQEDNVAVEFNTPPCATVDAFVEAIQYNLHVLTDMAKNQGLNLSIIPSAVFTEEELANPMAQQFGCDPDYNAWRDGARNPRPRANDKALRSAGGHIHIGGVSELDPIALVKAMDQFVGVPMVLFDTDTRRRELYGNPGAYRQKPYGVEYRTSSNAWIASEEKIRWVYDQTLKAVAFVLNGGVISDEQGEKIQQCIRTSDQQLAKELVANYE